MYMWIFFFLLMSGTVAFFNLAGKEDRSRGWLWAGISATLWVLSLAVLHWGFVGGLFLQFCLFAFMTGRNMWKDRQTLLQGAPVRRRNEKEVPSEFRS
ncbi:MAG: hypothetical protein ACYTFG_14465, partial [Planctomycetota bacterium]